MLQYICYIKYIVVQVPVCKMDGRIGKMGANPTRSRRCKRRVRYHMPLVLGRRYRMVRLKPEDLPERRKAQVTHDDLLC